MHDVAVIGLGALGVHAAAEAARRGLSVLGLEQFEPAHERGATGGRTRIFRVVYTQGADYVPALLEAREAWRALEERHPGQVWMPHGALVIGSPDDPEMSAALGSASDHGLPHEILSPDQLATRWPQHVLTPTDVAVVDPLGALLLPQSITSVVSREAAEHGAELLYGVQVCALKPVAGGTEIRTADGARHRARSVIVAAGAWTSRFVPEYAQQVQLRRVVLQWYPTEDRAQFVPQRFPVGLRRSGNNLRYSFFPQVDEYGIKVNFHVPKLPVDGADTPVNPVPDEYGQAFSHTVETTFHGVSNHPSRSAAYVESYTEDLRMLCDLAPGHDDVWVLGGGSGQAFKFAPSLARHTVDRVLGAHSGETQAALSGIVRGFPVTAES